ncbi:enoyl-CoA hydratase [Actinomadura sp. LD22]|uniref:Enoyl-CoA hydratase n=1 Tax=Actinomadura physcomitrii TaxID=2650748 RepID=A0A6I4MMP9_9ACTN|nr:enoyl-CoA hydratase [Actinomadura physcomitrii]MWA03496.1 enoyl-CoA hydratase [Actinomadura physcomitrii]
MSDTLTRLEAGVLTLTFDRPSSRNAMTPAMYEAVHEACERADGDEAVRVLVLRGAGTDAFVSGTDITWFTGFTGADDGVAYEAAVTRVLHRLQDVRVPTLAVVRGYCLGGGLALAAACDLRAATPSARFGAPIARTLGNCLSPDTHTLLLHHFGPGRCSDMLLNARLFTGREAEAIGFVQRLAGDGELEAEVDRLVDGLRSHAPLTMWAAKTTQRRLLRQNVPDGTDIIARVYGSADFRAGAEAFVRKEKPRWTGA